jgi:hypothetical protein
LSTESALNGHSNPEQSLHLDPSSSLQDLSDGFFSETEFTQPRKETAGTEKAAESEFDFDIEDFDDADFDSVESASNQVL